MSTDKPKDAAIELAAIHARGIPVYRARTVVTGILDRDGAPVAAVDLPAGTVVALAGLARPEAFRDTLDRLGITPAAFLPFPDHARYGDFRIGRILRTVEESGATALLTTEKDAVKLEGAVSLPVFRVGIEMRVDEPGFAGEVLARLDRSPS